MILDKFQSQNKEIGSENGHYLYQLDKNIYKE